MADAVIGTTVKVMLEKAISLATDRISLALGFKKELEALGESAKMVKAVLADAEDKQTGSELVRIWVEDVESLAFEIDNIFSEIKYETLRQEVKSMNKSKLGKVSLPFSSATHDISFRLSMSSKIREVNKKLISCNLKASEFGLIRNAFLHSSASTSSNNIAKFLENRESNSVLPEFIAGRSKEESEIVAILLDSSDQVAVTVLPIVGMGGLGKTTLAKSVYNNPQIVNHFSKRIWICVSENFKVTELFRLIFESLRGGQVMMSSQEAIVKQIRTELRREKFLLVIDDVWNEDPELWEAFFGSLVGISTRNGSCWLLTTRLWTTARLASPSDPYVLRKLKDDDCWSILSQKATFDGKMPEELDVHRNQILRRCGGLPLAAKVIGGLLRLQNKEDWLSIVESKILKLDGNHEGDNGIMQVLKLSFDYLPSVSIKRCFAYLSIFLKDVGMIGDELIQLWMAEGFLDQPDVGTETLTLEEIGGNYLRILVQSSLLEESAYDVNTGQDYKMHDLVHDLAELVSKTKVSILNNHVLMVKNNKGRYLALGSVERATEPINKQIVRTLFVNDGISGEVLSKFKHLRVLKFPNGMKHCLLSLHKLKHLCFLDITHPNVKVLPESLCKLYNLQTLFLGHSNKLQGLPRGMKNLISLRHLYYFTSDEKFQMPKELGRLTSLQTLEFFNIGETKGCRIKELGCMKNLKGSLEIRNLELVKGKQEAQSANLAEKKNLIRLSLDWNSTNRHGADNYDEHVLEGLKPHPKLQHFTVRGFMGNKFPDWLGKLSRLVELRLRNCDNCTRLTSLGNLPCLESLHLTRMRNLIEWKEAEEGDDDVVLFPKLEVLYISDCCQLVVCRPRFPSLRRLKAEGNVQPLVVKDILLTSSVSSGVLEFIDIIGMGGLVSLSDVVNIPLTSLKNLAISRCDELTSIPSGTLEGCRSLECIRVTECPNLVSYPLDLQQIPSLSVLDIRPKLFTQKDMPRGFSHLTNLEELWIGSFSDDSIDLFDWQGLLSCSSTLRTLHLCGSHQMPTPLLPHQLRNFTFLTSLGLMDFGFLESVPEWLGDFVSLESLCLMNCPKLHHLPSLDAMRRLTKLRSLVLWGCPLVREACERDRFRPNSYWFQLSSQCSCMTY